ncbi:MAG: hypothetical protein GEV28_32815 [Actinophytocola sp.]|nr:hypothetical protein [Actinophytocola sp.]MPZ84910.1 hypothetical protein [Actinophytocola sp.]
MTSETPSMTLPTTPCSVVWSRGHAYVREGALGRPRWVGVDDCGRPQSLTDADLHRRGWTRTRETAERR